MEEKLNKIIGQRINILRINAGVTQSKLSTLLGVSAPTISLYEKGGRSIPHHSILKLSNF